jgi:hypothetical protein
MRDGPETNTLARIKERAAFACFLCVDIPLSAVTDTLLLPIQIWTDGETRAWLKEIAILAKDSDGKETRDSTEETSPHE